MVISFEDGSKPSFLADIGPPYVNRLVFNARDIEKAKTVAAWLWEDEGLTVTIQQLRMVDGPVIVEWTRKDSKNV